MGMSTGDVICSCCGSYYGCKCRVQRPWGGFEEQRIANSLEKLVEILEKMEERYEYTVQEITCEGERQS